MRTHLYVALLLLGFLLLTACGGNNDSSVVETRTNKIDTSNCTLGESALGSCTLN